MARDSKIEWTHHTFNPWWGCAKVSPACKNCYAESWAKRLGDSVWGKDTDRRFFTDKHWNEPLKWDAEAQITGRRRVFCASMADVFERRKDLNIWRDRLWHLIFNTPNLDWLLLTKRPQNIISMVPWDNNEWPDNVWTGVTVENQTWAVNRLEILKDVGSKIKFLSCEPLLSALDLKPWMKKGQIDWVIAGGESGPHSRPMSPQWVKALRDQCQNHGVPFHFKQWGHWAPVDFLTDDQRKTITFDEHLLAPAGKKKAGRSLDGRTWDEVPLIA